MRAKIGEKHGVGKVSERAKTQEDYYARRQVAYFARPHREREEFAHRYADELAARLRDDGVIPFARLGEPARLEKDGLDPAWFATP